MEVNMTPGEKKYVHVEVCVKQESVADYQHVREAVFTFLDNSNRAFMHGSVAFGEDTFLAEHIETIVIADLEDCTEDELEDGDGGGIPHSEAELLIHVFKLSDESPAEQTTDDDENVSTCQELVLPSLALNGLWETLIYDAAVKRNVLDYATTAMLFSDSKVNPHIISWNRVVLLHGPPGTGKTSLCKALAQKLSIRLSERYDRMNGYIDDSSEFPNAFLIEINAHSLFSKWFSESGKLVMKLFRQIQELVEDDESLVCVLIDEVESLTAARKAALSGSEPSDAIRVVNALLTQLDSLKSYSNVLILTTSNITEAIDVAFVDRADIKQYIGLPSTYARYEILRSCVEELERVRIIQHSSFPILPYSNLMRRRASKKRLADQMNSSDRVIDQELALSSALLQVVEMAEGFSGRALRKLPFQAHAFFVHGRSPRAMEFLRNVARAVEVENESKKRLVSA